MGYGKKDEGTKRLGTGNWKSDDRAKRPGAKRPETSTWKSDDKAKRPGASTWKSDDKTKRPGASTWKSDDKAKRPGAGTWKSDDKAKRPGAGTWKSDDKARRPIGSTWKSDDREKRPEASTWKSDDREKRPETSTWKSDDRARRPEASTWKSDDRGKRPEAGKWKSDDRGKRPEAGKWKSDDRTKRPEADKWKSDEIKKPVEEVEEKLDGEETIIGEEEEQPSFIEGRNAVLEAFRSGRTIDKLYLQDGLQDGPIMTIKREARNHDCIIKFVEKERLDQMSSTGKHQGVIAAAAAYEYAELDDLFKNAEEKGEAPFFILLDDIEDPHNLGAIIRTANLAGAHGVIIPKNRAVGLTAVVARTSAGALNYTPVAKVTNLSQTIEELKKKGMWFVCADMGGTRMYDLKMTGSIGLVIGSEGKGVGRLVKEKCDMAAAIPMAGQIDSLNASVAAGILSYEIVRQRLQ